MPQPITRCADCRFHVAGRCVVDPPPGHPREPHPVAWTYPPVHPDQQPCSRAEPR